MSVVRWHAFRVSAGEGVQSAGCLQQDLRQGKRRFEGGRGRGIEIDGQWITRRTLQTLSNSRQPPVIPLIINHQRIRGGAQEVTLVAKVCSPTAPAGLQECNFGFFIPPTTSLHIEGICRVNLVPPLLRPSLLFLFPLADRRHFTRHTQSEPEQKGGNRRGRCLPK